ncbi:alpha/beta hydrolase [Nocardia terpenica]|uniref:alpha/beta fold hydrolase n=1 Tax=Nocardia terpenica TaxID=455432 RepID=UPI002FE30053
MTARTEAIQHFTVHRDGVTIPVVRGGRGRPLVFFPGLLTTQADLCELIGLLRVDHDVVTFDYRGHGRASAADSYSFEAFLGDVGAVLAELPHFDHPVLVGHSLGADLAVHYAAEYPDAVGELVLIDGANPIPEPFITAADLPEFSALWEEFAAQHEAPEETPRQVLLTAQDILDLNVELDTIRSGILDLYRNVECPITMIMSTSMAGDDTDGRTVWRNRNWRTGIERLVREHPHISTTWLDAGHALPLTHAPDIARIVRSTRGS